MSLFEFVSVMASIVLSLSLAIFLEGVTRLLRAPEGFRVSGQHAMWATSLFVTHFLVWWAVWDYREVSWTFPRFLALASTPLRLLFLSSLVLPGRAERSAVDLGQYFDQVRRWFTVGYALLFFIFIIDGPLIFASEEFWNAYRVPQTLALLAALVALRATSERVQTVAAIVVFLTTLSSTVFRFVPGAFS